jgi:hypothetical protein
VFLVPRSSQVPTGNKLVANAARTSPAESFWRAALPGAPMPEAIRELIHARAGDYRIRILSKDVRNLSLANLINGTCLVSADKASALKDADANKPRRDDGDIDPPPMNFDYDDYRAASRRNENPAPSADVLLKHAARAQNAAATSPSTTVFIILAGGRGDDADTSRSDPKHAALFRLLGVKPGGAAVCHDAQVVTAANHDIPVSP